MRKKIKDLGRLAVIAALSASLLAGCAGTSTSGTASSANTETTEAATTEAETTTEAPTTEPEPVDNSYIPSADTVKLLGRTYSCNDTLWLSYSASGVEFTAEGEEVTITIVGDSVAAYTNDNHARFAVFADGERVADQMLDSSSTTVTVPLSEDESTTIRVVKLSECAMSSIGISSIDVKGGTIAPTEYNDLYIEFVGDSITCAYGVDDEDKSHSFSTSTEDATKSYAYKAAELLNADYSLVAISGYGVVSGYTSGEKNTSQLMPTYYESVGFSYGTIDGQNVQDWAWDFERQPDVVVINLGTNDASYAKSNEKREEFQAAYLEFLYQIREKNPDAYIICSLGVMGGNLSQYLGYAVDQFKEETGDEKVETCTLGQIKADEGYAADWHPTEATHTRVADEIATEIKSVLGLE